MRDTQRERERGRDIEGEVGSLQGAPCGAQSWTLGSHPELKADAQPLSHPGIPSGDLFLPVNFTCFWALYILAYAIFLGVVFGNRFSCSILCLWDIAMSLHLAVSYSLHRSIEFLVWLPYNLFIFLLLEDIWVSILGLLQIILLRISWFMPFGAICIHISTGYRDRLL